MTFFPALERKDVDRLQMHVSLGGLIVAFVDHSTQRGPAKTIAYVLLTMFAPHL